MVRTVSDGTNGSDVPDGTDGLDGADGADGQTVRTVKSGINVSRFRIRKQYNFVNKKVDK